MPALTSLRQPRAPRVLMLTAALALAADNIRVRRQRAAARRDPLTGLPGRDALTARGEQLLARRRGGDILVVLLDGNGFKAVNDTYGHAAGDRVLIALAERLRLWTADHHGLAARLGGDEFAAIVPLRRHRAAQQLPSLAGFMNRPVPYEGQPLPVTAAIGAAHTSDLPRRPFADLLRAADTAMYRVKRGEAVVPHLGTTADADTPAENGRRPGRPGTHLPAATR